MMNKNCSFLWFVFINFWLTSTAKYLNVLFLNYFQINSTCCSLSGSSYDKRQIRYETPIRKYDLGARTGSGLALFKSYVIWEAYLEFSSQDDPQLSGLCRRKWSCRHHTSKISFRTERITHCEETKRNLNYNPKFHAFYSGALTTKN